MRTCSPDEDRVNAFRLDDGYYFRHYFGSDDAFGILRHYYDNRGYRFEVPGTDFFEVQTRLHDLGYTLEVVEEFGEFVVVTRKYSAHPENSFKASVYRWDEGDVNCFLLKNRAAVSAAVVEGATPLGESAVSPSRLGLERAAASH